MRNITLFQIVCLYIVFIAILAWGCGDETYYADPPKKNSKGLSAEVSGVLHANCSKCHGGRAFLSEYNAFKSQALPQIKSGKMPPGGGLSDKDKEILLSQ